MAVLEILVHISELIAAVHEMNQAMDIYKDAVEAAKSAADEMASQWEGASRDAFVRHQENAYEWHNGILGVVIQMIDCIRRVIELYDRTEAEVNNLMKG